MGHNCYNPKTICCLTLQFISILKGLPNHKKDLLWPFAYQVRDSLDNVNKFSVKWFIIDKNPAFQCFVMEMLVHPKQLQNQMTQIITLILYRHLRQCMTQLKYCARKGKFACRKSTPLVTSSVLVKMYTKKQVMYGVIQPNYGTDLLSTNRRLALACTTVKCDSNDVNQ